MIDIKDRKTLFTTYRDINLFIEAGAGAGKTQFISDKLIDLIIEGIDINKIILITFTNKAAEEMLSRISSMLIKKIKDNKDETIKDRLIKAKDNLFKLNVSTIHSFCYKLINENSFKAKVTYNATLLEEDKEEIRRLSYFNDFIKSLKKEDYLKINSLAFYAKPFKKIKEKYLALTSFLPDDNFNIDVIDKNDFIKHLENMNDAYIAFNEHINYPTSDSVHQFIAAYEALLSTIKRFDKAKIDEYLSSSNIAHLIEVAINCFNKKMAFSLSKIKGEDKEIARKINEDIASKKIEKDKVLTYRDKYINEYAFKAFKYYNDNFNRDELSNNYLIYLAYLLLKNDDKVKDILANKYDTIIVDEFQDTDRYQVQFIDILAKAITDRKLKEKKASTSLVVVGDPKQSIYRFRGADINSFLNYRDKSKTNKEVVRFPDNFRSNNYIIDYLNDIFSKKDFHDKYDYFKMKVAPHNIVKDIDDTTNKLAGVYSYPFNNDDEDNNALRNLANLVEYLVKNKYQIYKNNKFADVTYSDFLILTHSKNEINDIAKEFNKLNIKTKVAGKFDLSSSELFNMVYAFILYALDKQDNNRLAIRVYFDKLNSHIDFDTFINTLDNDIKDMNSYAKLMYILNTFLRQDIFISSFTDTDLKLYDIIVHELLENININTNVDSVHLLNEIDELINIPPEQQLSLINSNDEVNIMNVHKAKGLEGNIVIILDSGSEANKKEISDSNNIHYLSSKDKDDSILRNIEKEKSQERIRLEYVAMSRAKSVLIMENKYKAASHFFKSIEDAKEDDVVKDTYDFSNEVLRPYELSNTVLPSLEDVTKYFDKDIHKEAPTIIKSNKTFNLNNYDDLLKINLNSFSPSSKEIREDISSTSISINRPRNNIFGDAMHKAMELLINDYSKDISLIVKQAIREKEDEISINDKETYIKYLTKVVKAIKSLYDNDTSFSKYIKYPEYKFTVYLDDDNSLINGSMDLFMINDNHIKIIDYKSDIAGFKDISSFEDILKNRYQEQLKLYKKVANKLYPNHHIDLSIIYVEEHDDNEIAHEIKL